MMETVVTQGNLPTKNALKKSIQANYQSYWLRDPYDVEFYGGYVERDVYGIGFDVFIEDVTLMTANIRNPHWKIVMGFEI